MPKRILRVARCVAFALWLDHGDGWNGLRVILKARLTPNERAQLAMAALLSLPEADGLAVARLALFGIPPHSPATAKKDGTNGQ